MGSVVICWTFKRLGDRNVSIIELGALGEFLGSVAVVVTLVFLALQIRQNTKVSRSISVQQWNLAVTPQNEAVFRDREFAELLLRAADDYSSLDRIERRMYRSYCMQALNNFELLYLQRQQGTIDQLFFDSKIEIYLHNLELPAMRKVWETVGPTFLDARFREFVDAQLTKRGPAVQP